MSEPKRTPLYESHVALGARIVDFAGWAMPVQYSGVVDEHQTTRRAIGLFDVSHMGEVELRGPKALEAADRLITNDIGRATTGQAVYSPMCRPDGGIVDDLVAYRFSPERVFICVNASNRSKDFEWMKSQVGKLCDVIDRSDELAQIAVQGPKAAELLGTITRVDLGAIKTYRFAEGEVAGKQAIVSRTGYTGEDGFELYVGESDGRALWDELISKGAAYGAKPVGLGARDSLRLEMKFPLYGNDIDDTTNPLEAGLGWTVKLDKADFNGKDALVARRAAGLTRKLVGFEMIDSGIARHGYEVFVNGERSGVVTSGTKGPSVDKAIGMAYVPSSVAAEGNTFEVDIRGRKAKAVVVKTPFYKRH
ncbi:MAG: glycine cleavage system aminomethyltransferase GcvT [Deltaproteobacteria bacterium]|nr:glycine cleavage system aminomethyltransferase GcvT [Deltaproteobacteria bacterium]